MKNIALVSLLYLLISCQTNNLAVDYDQSFNFNNVKTYNYYNDNNLKVNQIDSANFIRNLDQALYSKGLVKDINNPDILIAVQVYNQAENRTSNIASIGLGGGSRWFGLGTSVGIPIRKKVMNYSFQIDFDDAITKKLIWTGQTVNTISYNATSEAKNSFYTSNIQSLLKKYPPQMNSKKTKSKKSNYYN
ncbi:DUF4136 domain-containing protein [Apibacter raozihei]|uniref:DUF4136 domain-containing protein n=1 Tax=Apibacter raozihei TaxID=2500547 RepID=UPI000FE3CE8A|nr:DUF4136 domain-containing protein [Apibacter raozihei]